MLGGIVEVGGTILARAVQRAEVSAQNMSNMTTPGYKARHAFERLLVGQDAAFVPSPDGRFVDFTPGRIVASDNPLDLAISGNGFFAVRSGESLVYTRNGQFSRASDGSLVTPGGLVLQSTSGDVLLGSIDITVTGDGMILDGGEPRARLAVVDFDDRTVLRSVGHGLFEAPAGSARDLASPHVLQGRLETSNVSGADEMLAMMAALRNAETGQRLVQVYDDLMAKALNAFGQQ